MKICKNTRVKGVVSGFTFDFKDDGTENGSILSPFNSSIYKNPKNIFRKTNTWLNLGNWLLGCLIMRNPAPPSFLGRGLTFFAIGEGDPLWTPTPTSPDKTNFKLVEEYYRLPLSFENFRAVIKSEYNYISHVDLYKIEIDSAISPVSYNSFIGNTMQIETDDPSDFEERFIIGVEQGTTDYFILDSVLDGTPTGADYTLFVPISVNENTISVLKDLEEAYIEMEVIISSDDANGTMREFALFGGWATLEKDSGMIWNIVRHAPVDKIPLTHILRRIRFELS
jgi:hypothetical protein